MGNIYLTSDWHFGHDREFVWGPRGFKSIHEMNEAIIENHNSIVNMEDDVYCLGDCMLGDNEKGVKMIKQLKGNLHLILGNHDTQTRIALYNDCYNVVEVVYATVIKYNKCSFYLSHYPTMTSNLEKSNNIRQHLINLYGHTHQQTNFYNGIPFMYHVGMDSHNCKPILIDNIIEEIKQEANKCMEYL